MGGLQRPDGLGATRTLGVAVTGDQCDNARMNPYAILALCLLAVSSRPVSAGLLDDAATPGPIVIDHGVKVEVLGDRRKIAEVDERGSVLGVFNPLFDGDAGKEGAIVSIRVATAQEASDFPLLRGNDYLVLRYSSGNVIVIPVKGFLGVRPIHCDTTGPDVVSRNIACRLDLARAQEEESEAENAKFLMPSPPLTDNRPLTYRIPGSGIVISVAADRRTVSASDALGRRLWTEDPCDAAGLKPYRFVRPVIARIGPFSGRDSWKAACAARKEPAVALSYDSTQFGCLNALTGRFVMLGQD